MGDLNNITAAGSTIIIGSDSTGTENNPVNADSSGNLYVKTTSAGPVTPGTVATASNLAGGQYNSSLPTLTTGQQSAIQIDSSGRIIISPFSFSVSIGVADKTAFTYGTTSQQTIGGVYQDTSPTLSAGTEGAVRLTANRAFHINLRDSSGNEKLGISLSAASIPVVLASDQAAIPVTQSGTWNLNNISGTISLPTGAATSANQATANASLSSIDTKLTHGQAIMASSVPVVLASDQSVISVQDLADGPVSAGTVATKSILIGGQYNTSISAPTNGQQMALQINTAGELLVASTSIESSRQSYSASVSGYTVVGAATDVFTISGSATKTIKITRIEITGTTTAGSGISISATLVKRTTLDTGGTSTTEANVPLDSNNAAGTAVVKAFTANPTGLGTSPGAIRAARMTVVNASAAQNYLIWDFGIRPAQAPVLRGVNDNYAINFGGASITGNIMSISIEWTEE